ncbi:hypothetical protein [Legionella spiritensis]|uniref:hypothetical protein n=1 Tax=Legionella spiritensis TaxID=452 RepID=UPI000F6FC32F|nr:hypothetical protein [Legionella spiritensis]VEG91174.1 Uncharacterised protein [Legionella spiritensis]
MTRRNLSKPLRSIKSFLFGSKKQQAYIASLEKACCQQALEIQRLKRQSGFY